MVTGIADPWELDTIELAGSDSLHAHFMAALRYAVLAPSSHNTQPWRFALGEDAIEVYADRTRTLPVVDPDGRELTISCGAALFHLRLALRCLGLREDTTIVPNGTSSDLLARVRVAGTVPPAAEDVALLAQVPRRRTNRLLFEARPLPLGLPATLRASAEAEGAWLWLTEADGLRFAVADLVVAGDRIQWADAAFRRELAGWLRPNWGHATDGIPGYAQGMGDVVALAQPLVVRTFDLGGGTAVRDWQIAVGSPALAVVGTAGDAPQDWLRAGQALARVLLRARADEVWASFLNQPIEVAALRPRLCELLGTDGYPQLLLRLGHGRDVRPSPRRPVDDVLVSETHG